MLNIRMHAKKENAWFDSATNENRTVQIGDGLLASYAVFCRAASKEFSFFRSGSIIRWRQALNIISVGSKLSLCCCSSLFPSLPVLLLPSLLFLPSTWMTAKRNLSIRRRLLSPKRRLQYEHERVGAEEGLNRRQQHARNDPDKKQKRKEETKQRGERNYEHMSAQWRCSPAAADGDEVAPCSEEKGGRMAICARAYRNESATFDSFLNNNPHDKETINQSINEPHTKVSQSDSMEALIKDRFVPQETTSVAATQSKQRWRKFPKGSQTIVTIYIKDCIKGTGAKSRNPQTKARVKELNSQ